VRVCVRERERERGIEAEPLKKWRRCSVRCAWRRCARTRRRGREVWRRARARIPRGPTTPAPTNSTSTNSSNSNSNSNSSSNSSSSSSSRATTRPTSSPWRRSPRPVVSPPASPPKSHRCLSLKLRNRWPRVSDPCLGASSSPSFRGNSDF
jgi:cytoskeletal protein RodZ